MKQIEKRTKLTGQDAVDEIHVQILNDEDLYEEYEKIFNRIINGYDRCDMFNTWPDFENMHNTGMINSLLEHAKSKISSESWIPKYMDKEVKQGIVSDLKSDFVEAVRFKG